MSCMRQQSDYACAFPEPRWLRIAKIEKNCETEQLLGVRSRLGLSKIPSKVVNPSRLDEIYPLVDSGHTYHPRKAELTENDEEK